MYPVGSQWFVYEKYDGLQTKSDPSKVTDGANVGGQNTSINYGDRISTKPEGYSVFPSTLSTTQEPIIALHTFRQRDATNIMMRPHGTAMEYYDSVNQSWPVLYNAFTSADFGYADYNINTDFVSYTYFGNAVESFARWTGFHTNLNGALVGGEQTINVDSTLGINSVIQTKMDGGNSTGDTTLNVDDTSSFTAKGVVHVGANSYLYSSVTATTFVLTSPLIEDIADEVIVAQFNNDIVIGGVIYIYDSFVADTSVHITIPFVGTALNDASVAASIEFFPGNPIGNLYMGSSNRLFIAGIEATPQAIFFSEYANALNYANALIVDSSTATSPGIFNLVEGGGGVVDMKQDEGSLYFFKHSLIYKATLTDSLYSLAALKPYDGKSQITGAAHKNSVFASNNGIFFVTPDNQIMLLTRIDQIDYPQSLPISDVIFPTVAALDFSQTSGISFGDKAYIACKSSPVAQANDTVLVWNITQSFWENPIIGWNVGDWTIYNDGMTEDLYFSDSITTNVYLVNDTGVDSIFDTTAIWPSKQFSFGSPAEQKVINDFFIEGYISQNSTISIALLLDENGFTKTYTTKLTGKEKPFSFVQTIFNLFGVNPFGIQVFGSNPDQSGLRKFRVYLNKNLREIPFYVAQVVVGSEGSGQQWEISRIGFLSRIYTQPRRSSLFRVFS